VIYWHAQRTGRPMTLTDYFEPRSFRSLYLKRTESVSGASALWALLLGPAYYWRKQAPVEALVLSVADLMLMFLPGSLLGIEDANDALGALVWLGFAFGAPVLLPMCYRRKGWVEIGRSAEARWLSDDFSRAEAGDRMDELAEHRRQERLLVSRGAERNRLR